MSALPTHLDLEKVWVLLETLKNESSLTERHRIFQENMKDAGFKWVVQRALDPTMVYNVGPATIASIEGPAYGSGDEIAIANFDKLLSALSSRALSGIDASTQLGHLRVRYTKNSWSVMKRILLKDLDCGITAKTVNKLCPGTLFQFDCMLAHPFEEKRVKSWPVAIEPKYDGMRVIAINHAQGVQFYTRSGKPVETLGHLKPYFAKLFVDVVYDGEIMAETFAKTMSQARSKNKGDALDAVFWAFDWCSLDRWRDQNEKGSLAYHERRRGLESLFRDNLLPEDPIKLVPRYLARSEREVRDFYQTFRRRGLEGAIVKPLDGLYRWKRSHDWMKLKAEETFEVVVKGFVEGEGKYQDALGALVCDFNGVEVRVGSGLTDDERRVIWENKALYVGKLLEVEAQEVTPDGSLRHLRAIGWRTDLEKNASAYEDA